MISSSRSIPGLADVEAITAIRDPVVRNLRITHCYHELTVGLAERYGGSANWCAFATWASKQAGQTIRGEDLSRAVEVRVGNSRPVRLAVAAVAERARAIGSTLGVEEIQRIVVDLLDLGTATKRAADAVARGNLKVFAEIARAFAVFAHSCMRDDTADPAALAIFIATLKDGDPPAGQRLLREAFSHYYRALYEPDLRARAELLLLANLQVGFHEQTRLQPEITEALNVAVPEPDAITGRLIQLVLPKQAAVVTRARRLLGRVLGGPTPLDRATRALVDVVREELRLVVTEHLMTLTLPGGERLRLGRDLSASFPESLAVLSNPLLLELLARTDRTPDSVSGSGASDWADLHQRMNFIADLFRCYHETATLLEPPFSQEQVGALLEGRRPIGPL